MNSTYIPGVLRMIEKTRAKAEAEAEPANPYDSMEGAMEVGAYGDDKIKQQNPLVGASAAEARKDPSKVQARIARAEWADYITRFAPIEQRTINDIQNFDYSGAGDRAGQAFAGESGRSDAATKRRLAAVGTSLTTEEKEAIARRRSVGLAEGIASSEVAARSSAKRDNDALTRAMLGYGRQSAVQANAALKGAASAATARETANEQNKAAADAAWRSTKYQMGGMAMGFGMMALGI